ncbi:hypothetical protein [Wenxinia saemankumensis]|uniref:Excalibur calcium-binding domain-containing protein n=1 Tax=Wenxinia saemankumensis TaxID=1447782 RepID=A0A1M6ASX7_9RHOB|nr:hypothetical protein [Wenxinia saemankumensis]SHI39619.1 hypothetical protein SAMN05444417_0607 [Wenxinia saemankumensis]
MLRPLLLTAALAGLAACAGQVPDSGRGVGTSDYSLYELERAQREAALRGLPTGTPIVPPSGPAGVAAPGVSATDLAAAGIGPAAPVATAPLGAPAAAPMAPAGAVPTAPSTPYDPDRTMGVQASPSNAAISDEQNFDAVASRESIESDAQRMAQNAAAYQVVQPTALPQRTQTGPNIVEYALNAPNRRGQEWYSRSILATQGRFERNCAAYRSPDEAQRDFLARGGPERDRLGLDPDGDGFACGWDPAPFLAAVGRS